MKVADSAGLTDPGRVRRRNEDAFVCEPPLFAVADGMGGAQAGELASRIAVSAFRDFHAADELDPEARLRSIIQEANRRIFARAARDPEVSGMGTTATAALVSGDRVAVGHVGDARAYRLREGQLVQLTEDHSLVADLVRSGRLSPEEAELHPQRSVITRALGTDPGVVVDSFSTDAQPGDVFLLCSDGLTTMLGEAVLAQTLAGGRDLKEIAQALVAAANREGGDDNITVVLFALAEGETAPGEEHEDDEDTLSGLRSPVAGETAELPATTAVIAAPPRIDPVAVNGSATTVIPTVPASRPSAAPRRARRAALIVVAILALFAGLAALALWGLSRAHFVGADSEGKVAVYQGVPWNVFGGVELYREVYVSQLQADQLSPEERATLFDHDLVSEADARGQIARYEEEASPGQPPA